MTMNENVTKVYAELIEIRNGLAHASNQEMIAGCMKRLDDSMVYLQSEPEYTFWATSLREAVERFNSGDGVVDMEYIINYAEKLAELIEVKSEQEEAGNTYSHIREDAKVACENIANTVQMGFQTVRERVKADGPKYAAGAANKIRAFGQVIENGLRNWVNADDSEQDEQEEPAAEEKAEDEEE